MSSFRAVVAVALCVGLMALSCSDAPKSGGDGSQMDTTGDDAALADTADGAGTSTKADAAADAESFDAEPECVPWKCAGRSSEPVNPCEQWQCSQAGKCVSSPAPDGVSCDDGDACTANSVCKAGKCQGGDSTCQCKPGEVEGCYALLGVSKGDLCAGTPICAKGSGPSPYECQLDPASGVTCPTDKDTECIKNTCDPKTGSCAFKAVNEGGQCDDGIKCTMVETCKAGKCTAVLTASSCFCTPGNVEKCWGKLNLFPDDKLCDGEPFCQELYDPTTKQTDYKCALNQATVVVCNASKNTACLKMVCDPKDGQCKGEPQADKKTCDDGDPCTAFDTCQSGKCVGDISLCGCKNNADCVAQDDNDACNGVATCDLKTNKCVWSEPVVCASSGLEPCVLDVCVPLTGVCKQVPAENVKVIDLWKLVGSGANLKKIKTGQKLEDAGSKVAEVYCDDGNACTVSSVCAGKVCSGGTNVCPPCATDNDCAGKSKSKCVGELVCKAKACEVDPAKAPKPCAGAVAGTCLKQACDPQTGGCAQVSNPHACDDNNDCTVDSCGGDKKTCVHQPGAKGLKCYTLGKGEGACDGKGACVVP